MSKPPFESNTIGSPAAYRILIFEADLFLRQVLTEFLEWHGWHVRPCADAASGLQAYSEADYDGVILDGHLPDAEAPIVYQRLRAIPKTGRVPILIVDGVGDHTCIQEILACHLDGFSPKPYIFGNLMKQMTSLILISRETELA